MSYNSGETKIRFIEIIRENDGLIYKVSKMYSNSFEDEQDLFQDIVYQLWKSFSSFRNESKITTWMYRIALNTGIHYLDKGKKKAHKVSLDETLLNRPEIIDESKQDQYDMMFAQIKRLNDIERGIIFLYLEGKAHDEIAMITGFTITNIGTRIGRIKQKLISQINLNKAGNGI
ncbi:RNA polymerase ECF-type sigma factor [Pedobacter sp. BAL39]|uniref:RNA polymerase sigma factor n=1 Tax=Pedobacter sp. BAL39 TaxID=391596 RepID=UPI000155992F|nr:sigma-70 family RNA polymerase sigma factor [Pedobacter sp. BAL39]EDM36235.1 RNA polymerase ECF-type sigma factor [Pedobacter sp. BAL39]